MMSEDFYNNYVIDTISDETGTIYDLFLPSGEADYDWEYYNSYDDINEAHAEGVAACKRAANA